MSTPASNLKGKILNDRWEVLELMAEKSSQTGGCQSCQYKVIDRKAKKPKKAFLKAIDLFKKAESRGGTPTDALRDREYSIRSFRYESKLLELCEGRKMARVVRSLDAGIYEVPLPDLGISIEVPFIVFELAEGDLRNHPEREVYNLAWRMKVFHGLSVAMSQLHQAEIAHQDIKPSNVLVFEKDFSKIGDLGRATLQEAPSAYEADQHMGDNNYIPFELLYGHFHPRPWHDRRFGADFFMLGCVLTYLITDSSFLVLTLDRLDRQFWPGAVRSYDDALPHLQRAVEEVLDEIRQHLPKELQNEIVEMIYRLCDPDCRTRGWPRRLNDEDTWEEDHHHLGRFDLQQVISKSDSLSKRAIRNNLTSAPIADKRSFLDFFNKRP